MSVKFEILDTAFNLYQHEAGQSWYVSGYNGTPIDHWDAPDRPLKLREVSFWQQKPGGAAKHIESIRLELPEDGMELEVVRAKDNEADLENDFVREYFLQPLVEVTEELLAVDAIHQIVPSATTSGAAGSIAVPSFRVIDRRCAS
jgi:hypothetical protein